MARKKTEARRQQILEGAAALFSEQGFHQVTLADIARHIGFSKVTIYNYFTSKNELLRTMLVEGFAPAMQALVALLEGDQPLADRLRGFCELYILMMTNEYALASTRLMVSQVGVSELGDMLSSEPSLDPWPHVERQIERAVDDGELQGGSAAEITRWLRALVYGDRVHHCLTHSEASCSPGEATEAATKSVAIIVGHFRARERG